MTNSQLGRLARGLLWFVVVLVIATVIIGLAFEAIGALLLDGATPELVVVLLLAAVSSALLVGAGVPQRRWRRWRGSAEAAA